MIEYTVYRRVSCACAVSVWRTRTVLLVEQDLELVGEVVVERAVDALHRLLLRQLAVHPRAAADTTTRHALHSTHSTHAHRTTDAQTHTRTGTTSASPRRGCSRSSCRTSRCSTRWGSPRSARWPARSCCLLLRPVLY